jgi:hypothetical protein
VAFAWLRSSKSLAHLHGDNKDSTSAFVGLGIQLDNESK